MRAGDVNPHDLPELERQRAAMVALARAMLRGEVGVLEGSRKMLDFVHTAGIDSRDEDLLVFVGIDSQEDHLPVGSERGFWSPDRLAALAPEIAKAEAVHRPGALAACKSLVRRFGGG